MANNVYKKKMGTEEAISNLQLYFNAYMYPKDLFTDSVETVLWLLNENKTTLSEAQELYNEGFQDGYRKGYQERKEK